MSDYAEEQEGEIEALQSIYIDDEFVEHSASSYTITIAVEEDRYSSEAENNVRLSVTFTYPETYPDVPVEYVLTEHSALVTDDDDDADDDEDADNKRRVITPHFDALGVIFENIASESEGEAYVFTLMTEAKEWVDATVKTIRTDRIKQEEAEALAKVEVKIEGTPCTMENFTEWKERFQLELGVNALTVWNAAEDGEEVDEGQRRLTGKQQFLADQSLAKSDLKDDQDATPAADD